MVEESPEVWLLCNASSKGGAAAVGGTSSPVSSPRELERLAQQSKFGPSGEILPSSKNLSKSYYLTRSENEIPSIQYSREQ